MSTFLFRQFPLQYLSEKASVIIVVLMRFVFHGSLRSDAMTSDSVSTVNL